MQKPFASSRLRPSRKGEGTRCIFPCVSAPSLGFPIRFNSWAKNLSEEPRRRRPKIHREHDHGMTDEYCDALENLIEQEIEHGDKAASSSLAEWLADRVLHVIRGRGHQMNAGAAVAR